LRKTERPKGTPKNIKKRKLQIKRKEKDRFNCQGRNTRIEPAMIVWFSFGDRNQSD